MPFPSANPINLINPIPKFPAFLMSFMFLLSKIGH
jgi:hypothetical protein